ncbi:sterol O-acyltransferase 1-like, partial [Arctopsyche grandis]
MDSKNKMKPHSKENLKNIIPNGFNKEKKIKDKNKNNNRKCDILNNNYCEDKVAHPHQNTLQDRIFIPRNSLLTDLYEISHVRTIYHILIVALIILFLNNLIYDILDTGRINIGGRLIIIGFGKFDVVLTIWICMQLVAFLPYVFFRVWANTRNLFSMNGTILRIYDGMWLCIFVTFQMAFLFLSTIAILKSKLPAASGIAIAVEMVRFIMKMHAFIRTVAPRVLERPVSSKNTIPDLSKYIYFMFAPTLLYRDSYPRNDHIRWNKVIIHLFEFATVVYFTSILLERYLIPNWSLFGHSSKVLELKEFVQMIFHSMLPGTLFYLSGFYLLLHCWLNVTAELLTFADRRFYM